MLFKIKQKKRKFDKSEENFRVQTKACNEVFVLHENLCKKTSTQEMLSGKGSLKVQSLVTLSDNKLNVINTLEPMNKTALITSSAGILYCCYSAERE